MSFRFECLQVETIEERPIAFRRRARAGQIDPIAILQDCALSAERARDGRARIVVAILLISAPNKFRRSFAVCQRRT